MAVKVRWAKLPGPRILLQAYPEIQPRGYEVGLSEHDLDPVQHWCRDNLPGAVRISFDTWRFKTHADLTAFLLKWEN